MFGHGKSRHGGHGKPKNTKKHHVRNWMHSQKKKKQEANLFAVMMSSSDPSSPTQASISTTSFDVLDDARLEKINVTPVTSQLTKPVISPAVNTDADAIEEAVPIVQTTLPVPESVPKLEKNGIEVKTKKSPDEPNDECLINCIYFTQQCCDCTIS
ncbi:centrosomal protein of 97 kDa isoform X2 [Solenopsis invicta]|uniref:centrosomal protein of 97 kDa isoform X2 n=1 Tax=Solenopsis invicta TaxID=13686 RepID=UPI00059617EB|nr:centrosomal protein of 97 kDa isoform X2 [Solenopsis invicta]